MEVLDSATSSQWSRAALQELDMKDKESVQLWMEMQHDIELQLQT